MTEQMRITGDYFVIVNQHYERDVRTNTTEPYDTCDALPARDMAHATLIAGAQSLLPGDRKVFIAVAIAQVQPQFAITQLVEAVPAEPVQGVDQPPHKDVVDLSSLDNDDIDEILSEQQEMMREDEEEDRRAEASREYDREYDKEDE